MNNSEQPKNGKHKAALIFAGITAGVTAAAVILLSISGSVTKGVTPDAAARQWSSEDIKYAQISAYFSPEAGLEETSVYSIRQDIKQKLKENQLLENDSSGRIWLDCAAADSFSSYLTGASGSCTADVTVTMGDYFIFHPEKLISGSYYSDSDININRIILDKLSSWQLFGAMDTAGMTVTLNGNEFTVAAVVEIPTEGLAAKAYGQTPRVYIPSSAIPLTGRDKISVISYEACIPQPVPGFAKGIMEDAAPGTDLTRAVTDQSGRFEVMTLFKGFREVPESIMVNSELRYPWYENHYRSVELIARILTGIAMYMLILPLIAMVPLIFGAVKLAGKGVRAIFSKGERAYQRRISEEYYKTHPKPAENAEEA